MKKVLWLIVCLMTMVIGLSSCGSAYIATANYEVCYPDGTRKYDGSVVITSKAEPIVSCYSHGGTNYISAIGNSLEVATNYMGGMTSKEVKKANVIASSTAPMRLNSYKVEKTKKKARANNNDGIYLTDILSSRK